MAMITTLCSLTNKTEEFQSSPKILKIGSTKFIRTESSLPVHFAIDIMMMQNRLTNPTTIIAMSTNSRNRDFIATPPAIQKRYFLYIIIFPKTIF